MMNFDKITPRHNTNCLKYDALKQRFGFPDLLPLWVADMDFTVAQPIIDAIESKMKHHIYGYSVVPDAFFESIINRYKKNNIIFDAKNMLLAHGIVPSLSACVQAFTKTQEFVVFQPPIYPPFYDIVLENNRQLAENPLVLNNGRYEIDLEELSTQLQKAKLFLLCHPHNPSGRVFTKEELSKIIDLCLEHDVILVSDEVHSDIVYQPHQFHSILSFDKAHPIAIVLDAASKSYNIAGFSTSYIISYNEELLKKLPPILKQYYTAPNFVGITATIAAYNESQSWLDTLLIYLQSQRDFVLDFMMQEIPMLKPIAPEATYLIWIDFNQLQQSHEQIKQRLLENAKIALNNGKDFGGQLFFPETTIGNGFFRLNFAVPRATLEQGLYALKQEFQS